MLRAAPSPILWAVLVTAPVLAGAASGCATGTTDDIPVNAGRTGKDAGATSTNEDAGLGDDDAGEVGGDDAGGDDNGGDSGIVVVGEDGSTGTNDSGTTTSDSGTGNAACTAALATATYNFESGEQGWTDGDSDGVDSSGINWPFDPWTQGTSGNGVSCPSGECWGAELTENYAQCQRGYLLSPTIDLSACAGQSIDLKFDHLYSFAVFTYNSNTYKDAGIVEVSGDDGTTWTIVPSSAYSGTAAINGDQGSGYACTDETGFYVDGKQGFVGAQTTVQTVSLPLTSALVTSTVRVRFSFASGVSSKTTSASTSRSGTSSGWRVDNVRFVAN